MSISGNVILQAIAVLTALPTSEQESGVPERHEGVDLRVAGVAHVLGAVARQPHQGITV